MSICVQGCSSEIERIIYSKLDIVLKRAVTISPLDYFFSVRVISMHTISCRHADKRDYLRV